MTGVRKIPWAPIILALIVAFPFLPDQFGVRANLTQQMSTLFAYGLLALGLNVVVGYVGLLHLGIGAFFGVGAFVTGIVMFTGNPFQLSFLPALALSTIIAAAVGVLVSAPTLRLRGDYLALVTMGFGLIAIKVLVNLDAITNGTKNINPVPPPSVPSFIVEQLPKIGFGTDWSQEHRLFYFYILFFLAIVYWMLGNLERSRLGRAWVAIREDELAATCMGLNVARLKLLALALGAGIAGFAGALYAVKNGTTQDPEHYGFNRSMTILCCLILGGLGGRGGTLFGVALIVGFDNILAPRLDAWLQQSNINPNGRVYLSFSGWKLMLFGLILIVMMRFRPNGLLPASREHPNPPKPSLEEA